VELRDGSPRFDARGVALAMVLPQRCARIAEAFGIAGDPPAFPLLCDEDRAVTRRYGVWDPIGLGSFNTAHPAAFLIDARDRAIRYAFVGRSQFERAPLEAILGATAER
jgi:peroxiredoxin